MKRVGVIILGTCQLPLLNRRYKLNLGASNQRSLPTDLLAWGTVRPLNPLFSDLMISRSASPVLALSGLSLVAVIWLGLRLGLSHNSSRIRKNKASDVPGSTPPAVKPRKFSKKHVSTSPDLKDQVGVSVSEELERAINECKEMVEIISNDCRATNKKFRYS